MLPKAARRTALVLLISALTLASATDPLDGQAMPSPEDFFGHVMGADRTLEGWERLVSYYDTLGALSDRLLVQNVGPSTLGRPFLVIFASSPENLANLDRLKALNQVLADPRGHSEAEVDEAIQDGKVVFVQAYALHSTEVAASQSAAEIVYDFASRTDDEMERILDETVSILVPGMNPDGVNIVTDWYNRWVGTQYEAAGLPELYHHYIGHDNNRDAFMQNTVESQYVAEILFREWPPAGLHRPPPDGSLHGAHLPTPRTPSRFGPRAILWCGVRWPGTGHTWPTQWTRRDLPGAIGSAIYSGWGHFGFHWITPFHNIAGMLTESASARLATPLYVHPDQLRGSRQLPEYEEQTTFPNPVAREAGGTCGTSWNGRVDGHVLTPGPGVQEPGDDPPQRIQLKAARQTATGAPTST